MSSMADHRRKLYLLRGVGGRGRSERSVRRRVRSATAGDRVGWRFIDVARCLVLRTTSAAIAAPPAGSRGFPCVSGANGATVIQGGHGEDRKSCSRSSCRRYQGEAEGRACHRGVCLPILCPRLARCVASSTLRSPQSRAALSPETGHARQAAAVAAVAKRPRVPRARIAVTRRKIVDGTRELPNNYLISMNYCPWKVC
jgi:hypothetical protein